MHLRTLKLFCDVVARGSFSKAAAANDVSQSLASQAVTGLEHRLGVLLLDRSKRPLQPTPAGSAYAAGCRVLIDQFKQLEDQVLRLTDRVTGQVRIASIYSVGLLEMGQYVESFRHLYPDVDVRMEYLHPTEVYERVRSDKADLGLVSFPREGGEFRSTLWQQQDLVLVVPPSHSLAEHTTVGVSQLCGLSFVTFTRELRFRRKLDRWLKDSGVAVKVVHEFDNVENIKRSVEIGSGVAILPLKTVRRETEYGLLAAVRIRGVDWKRPLGIVQKRNRNLAIAAARFVNLLLESPASPAPGPAETPASPQLAGPTGQH